MKHYLLSLPLITSLFVPLKAVAQSTREIVCQHNPFADECQGANESTFLGIINNFIDVLMWVVGVGAVIVIIIAGLMYVLSGGNADRAKKAKDAIIYTMVGVVVVFFARAIVQFIVGAV